MPGVTDAENRALFGPWASPYNHGHNYVLDVEAKGEIDPRTGMVVNIKDIDAVLQREVVQRFDQKSLNDEIAHFQSHAPTLENLLHYIASQLAPHFSLGHLPATLTRLRLEEMPTLWAELDTKTTMLTVTRTYEFAASHRLHVPALSEAENLELFGKCNNLAGHGHNYVLEVTVTGDIDPRTGMSVDLGELDKAVEERIVDRYDHRNFNEDLPEYRDKVPTSEVIVQQIWDELDGHLPAELSRVRLHETARNVFELSR
jgi:6-pyruvoyltetrahydropterin/6-carboxytetrahydropterin synthase